MIRLPHNTATPNMENTQISNFRHVCYPCCCCCGPEHSTSKSCANHNYRTGTKLLLVKCRLIMLANDPYFRLKRPMRDITAAVLSLAPLQQVSLCFR